MKVAVPDRGSSTASSPRKPSLVQISIVAREKRSPGRVWIMKVALSVNAPTVFPKGVSGRPIVRASDRPRLFPFISFLPSTRGGRISEGAQAGANPAEKRRVDEQTRPVNKSHGGKSSPTPSRRELFLLNRLFCVR